MQTTEQSPHAYIYIIGLSSATPDKFKVGEFEFIRSYAYPDEKGNPRHILYGKPLGRDDFNGLNPKVIKQVREWTTYDVAVFCLQVEARKEYPALEKARMVRAEKRAKLNDPGQNQRGPSDIRVGGNAIPSADLHPV